MYEKGPKISPQFYQDLKNQKLASLDKNKLDPIILINLGSKATHSSTYTSWVISFNPAYAYIKPWWITVISFKFLSGNFLETDGYLSPGFCPYKPYFDVEDYFTMQEVLNSNFEPSERRITATITPINDILSPNKSLLNHTGIRYFNMSEDSSELWLQIAKLNATHFGLNEISLESNPPS